MSRYGERDLYLTTRDGIYKEIFDKRDLGGIVHWSTPRMNYPTVSDMTALNVVKHTWREGDRYWKLAAKHYNNAPNLWWVIAWFNKAPTEGHLQIGDIVYIPSPIERVLDYLETL